MKLFHGLKSKYLLEESNLSVELSIVIPVYNEGDNIKRTLKIISDKIKATHNIYIIYDFDSDNTIPIIQSQYPEQNNIYLRKNIFGEGALNAIKTGFTLSSGKAVLVAMADLADDLSIVDEMYSKIVDGYDIVCGSRYMKGGNQIGGPKFKKKLSSLAGKSLNILINIPTHDITNSFKMYRKQLLEKINIESNGGFELGMEITIKAYLNKFSICEIPTTWNDRDSGESRFRLMHWLPKYIHWYLYALKRYYGNKLRLKSPIE
jgi:dolichol-phosphate mannosyltransferase